MPGLSPNTTDESFFNTVRRWVAPDLIFAEKSCQALGRDLKSAEAVPSEFISTEMKQAGFSRSGGDTSEIDQKHEYANEKVAVKEITQNLVSLSGEQLQKSSLSQGVIPLLNWGSQKRRRCSRVPNRHGPRVYASVDEYNTVQIEAAKGSSIIDANTRCVVASKLEDSESEIPLIGKSDYVHYSLPAFASEHPGEACKHKRSSDSREGERGACVLGKRSAKEGPLRSPQVVHQQDCLPQESITCSSSPKNQTTSPERKTTSLLDRQATVPIPLEKKLTVSLETHTAAVRTDGSRVEAGPVREDFALPPLVIELSRRQKAEDLLIFKGTKISSRPNRRPRVVQNALLECTPGNCLSNVSYARYNVREKKPIVGKPRGSKAIESMDMDSE